MNVEKITVRQIMTHITPRTFVGVISTIASTIVGAFWLGYYFANQLSSFDIKRKEFEIQSYKDRWANIEPQLALERYFNFKKQVISSYDKDIPPRSVVINNEFLARTDLPGLTYQKMIALEWQKQKGRPMLAVCETKVPDLGPIHIWKGSRIYQVKTARGIKVDLIGQIAVQKMPKARFEARMLEFIKCFQTKESELQIGKETGVQLEQLAKNLRRVDLVGFIHAQNELHGYLIAALDPDYEWKSYVVEKQEGYLYSIGVRAQNNVEMQIENTTSRSTKIYERIQSILVEVPNSVYSITISSPSELPTVNLSFAATSNQWLADLRLLYD